MLVLHRVHAVGLSQPIQDLIDAWGRQLSFTVALVSGGRTAAEQHALYAQGRTTPGAIVTHADNPEESPHCHFAAVDAMPVVDGRIDWGMADPHTLPWLHAMADIATSMGCAWGGNWINFKDWDHFEDSNWRNLPVIAGVADAP